MKKKKFLFDQLQTLVTEQRNKQSLDIDMRSISQVLHIINREDRKVAIAVKKEIPQIGEAVKLVVKAFQSGGRLIYIGAGTSGRLGILDAAECPPTYGTDSKQVQGIIAGGSKTVFRSQEGVEDHEEEGARAVRLKKVGKKDIICGIAASARTPFVIAALREAKKRGATTIYVTTNPRSMLRMPPFRHLSKYIDVAICPDVGPEVIMGSTRMKSGTAQKLVLNMITTTAMIKLGKIYENMMVDLKMNSKKLEERAKRVLMIITGVDYEKAEDVLSKAGGHVKTAIIMIKANVTVKEAKARLKKANGFVRIAIEGKKI
jgi:N-acetylmuramic acid 6-phosphate etherase